MSTGNNQSQPTVPKQDVYAAGLNQTGYFILVVSILFMIISPIAVALRLWTRRLKRTGLGIDDWLAIVSVVIFFGFCGDILVGVYTLGSGQVYLEPSELSVKSQQFLKAQYAIPPLYATNVTVIKFSILFLYRRIFSIVSFLRLSNIVIGVCLAWWVVAIIADLLCKSEFVETQEHSIKPFSIC